MHTERTNFLIALGLLCFVVLGCSALARKVIPQGPPEPPKPTPVLSGCKEISVADLRAGAIKNQYYWDQFRDTPCLDISGTVRRVNRDYRYLVLNSIENNNESGALFKFQPDRKADLAGVNPGDSVVVRAVCCESYGVEYGKFSVTFSFSRIVR